MMTMIDDDYHDYDDDDDDEFTKNLTTFIFDSLNLEFSQQIQINVAHQIQFF